MIVRDKWGKHRVIVDRRWQEKEQSRSGQRKHNNILEEIWTASRVLYRLKHDHIALEHY